MNCDICRYACRNRVGLEDSLAYQQATEIMLVITLKGSMGGTR
jgi:hypothetical protein